MNGYSTSSTVLFSIYSTVFTCCNIQFPPKVANHVENHTSIGAVATTSVADVSCRGAGKMLEPRLKKQNCGASKIQKTFITHYFHVFCDFSRNNAKLKAHSSPQSSFPDWQAPANRWRNTPLTNLQHCFRIYSIQYAWIPHVFYSFVFYSLAATSNFSQKSPTMLKTTPPLELLQPHLLPMCPAEGQGRCWNHGWRNKNCGASKIQKNIHM